MFVSTNITNTGIGPYEENMKKIKLSGLFFKAKNVQTKLLKMHFHFLNIYGSGLMVKPKHTFSAFSKFNIIIFPVSSLILFISYAYK